MIKRQTFHVTPTKDRWNVKREGAQRPAKTFDNKKDAVDFGKQTAKNQRLGQIIIHKKDGTIQTEHTYRKDPYPPKG
jgi:hypothetical protein